MAEGDITTELDKRLSVHEAQCAERYATILHSLNSLELKVSKIYNKAFNALIWLTVSLFTSLGGLIYYIITRSA